MRLEYAARHPRGDAGSSPAYALDRQSINGNQLKRGFIIKKFIIAGATALALTMGIAAPAQASVGGVVYNQTISNGKIIAKDPTGFKRDVWPGRSSEWVGIYDADYFWVPGGCDAWSQWGHKYVGNTWYGKLPNDALLSLKVIC